MMNRYGFAVMSTMIVLTLGLSGCDKKESPVQTDEAAATSADSTKTKTENDIYIENLNKDVKVDNPDALLDEVNQETKGK